MAPNPAATSVGLGLQSHDAYAGNQATVGVIGHARGALSPRRAIETIKGILSSPQFIDGVRLFAIGAAVSASKMAMDAVLAAAKRFLFGEAIFRDRDGAYRWILLHMITQSSFKESPRAVEVSVRPSLLAEYDAAYRGSLSEEELSTTWSSLEPRNEDEKRDGRDEDSRVVSRVGAKHGGTHHDSIGVHMFPAAGESVHFVFEKTHFWASRRRELVGDTSWEEVIAVTFLSTSAKPLQRLIKHAKANFEYLSRGRISIHRIGQYGDWVEAAGIAKRSIDSVHLPGGIKNTLLQDAQRFTSLETQQWYGDRGIPYRRGYLLYGKPGSGKTSMCHALASELERPIYILSLAAPGINDEKLVDRMSEVPRGSIVLMEDIDAAFGKGQGAGDASSNSSARSSGSSLSFSAVLNAIDGIGAAEGRLLCMTTNHIDRLDSALIRPGRIDASFQFEDATQDQARELFLRWYSPSPLLSASASAAKDPAHTNVEESAARFSTQIPPRTVSVAAIQGFLLSCGTDEKRALREVSHWIRSQQSS